MLGLVLALSAASVPVFRLVAEDAAGVEAERAIELALRGAQYHAAEHGHAMRLAVADDGAMVRLVHDHGDDADAIAVVVDEWRLPDGGRVVGPTDGVVPGTLAYATPMRAVREGDPCVLDVGGALVGLDVGSVLGGEPVRFVYDVEAADAAGAGGDDGGSP